MQAEIGEYIVGAYLKIIKEVDYVDYNVRPPKGGLEGLAELDVVGLDIKTKTAYLCEVTTHILGLRYGDYEATYQRLLEKHQRQQMYANKYLKDFILIKYMFWSPIVPEGDLTDKLKSIEGLELIINDEYTKRIDELKKAAKDITQDTGNPFFRTLQILERLKRIESL